MIAALLALDRERHDLLIRILRRCAAAASEFIADNGGLYDVLTSEEMLEADAAAEREDRRAAAGYVAPTLATSFLKLARRTPLEQLITANERDPVTRAYFRELERAPSKRARARTERRGAIEKLEHLLRDAGVIDSKSSVPKLARVDARPASLLARALTELAGLAPETHAERLEELAFVTNVLISGTSVDRTLRPVDALARAVDLCERGLLEFLDDGRPDALHHAVRALRENGAEKLFRIGWNLAAARGSDFEPHFDALRGAQ